ncbi:MAG: hypothetical protein UW05_C0036G0007 [Candidatus Giovannonibacteria bacterium GW2011_GWC2_43_8]|nr:MAG: hypothetical protein UW05_C0036G0007 [Candidatus Giovannonibacteria bacterium GW2011_GWC2_43_8]
MSVDFSSKVGSVSFRGSLGQATKPRYRRPAMFQEAVAIILDPSTPRKEASYHISQWGGKENVTEETLQSWRELSFFVKNRGSNHFEAIRFGTISLRNMPDNLLLDLLKNDDCRGALTVGQVGQIGRGFYSSLELSDLALVVKLFERLGVSVEDKKWGFIGRAALTHINKLFGDYFSAVSRTSEDETMGVVAGEIKKAVDGSLWPVVFRFLESEESQKMLFKESDPQGGLYKDLPEILDRVAKDGYTEILWHGSDKWQ